MERVTKAMLLLAVLFMAFLANSEGGRDVPETAPNEERVYNPQNLIGPGAGGLPFIPPWLSPWLGGLFPGLGGPPGPTAEHELQNMTAAPANGLQGTPRDGKGVGGYP